MGVGSLVSIRREPPHTCLSACAANQASVAPCAAGRNFKGSMSGTRVDQTYC